MAEEIRILHVDDEPEFADVTATFLERQGDQFAVETATDPREATDRLTAEAFDCVVSDYDMPRVDGIEFLETVRADYPDLPFILFTGKGGEDVASEAISAGVSDYLQKDGTSEQYELLATRIQGHVERARAQRDRNRQLAAIETATEGISILDDEGQFEYVNEAYADLYGYTPAEMVGEPWELIYPDEDVPWIREDVLPTVESEGLWKGETTGLRADGSTFTEDHTLAATDNGGLVCTVRDMTQQQSREDELRRQKERLEDEIERRNAAEQRYRSLFEHNPVVTWEYDFSAAKQYLDDLTTEVDDLGDYFETNPGALQQLRNRTVVVDVNETAVEYYGADSKESLLDNVERVIPEESWEVNKELWESVAAGEDHFRSETVAQTVEGDRRFQILELYIPGADQDDYSRAYLTGTDITERKTREQTLTALHDAARDIGAASDEATVYETLIETAKKVLEFDLVAVDVETDGYLVQEAWNLDSDERDYWERTSLADDDSFAIRAYNRQETILVNDLKESELTPADPEYRSALTVPIGTFGTFQAVFSQPGAFDDRDIAFAELLVGHARVKLSKLADEQQLRARTAELERQNERLDEFASVVSHDLRNPLNVAKLRLDLVAEESDSEHVDDIDQALERMEQLTEDLLTLTRSGRSVEETEPVRLSTVCEECWETVETSGATLDCETDWTVQANRNQLMSVFENLFSNAVEHGSSSSSESSSRGGGTHTDEGVTITVGDTADGFYVADDGDGIPEDERDHIFERGYSTTPGGTGLGLMIVRDIVEAHGWTLTAVESSAGGARFEITGVDGGE